MLRIITSKRGTAYRLELHGTIAGEWIAVLERHWRDIWTQFLPPPLPSVSPTWCSSIGAAKSCSAGWRSAA